MNIKLFICVFSNCGRSRCRVNFTNWIHPLLYGLKGWIFKNLEDYSFLSKSIKVNFHSPNMRNDKFLILVSVPYYIVLSSKYYETNVLLQGSFYFYIKIHGNCFSGLRVNTQQSFFRMHNISNVISTNNVNAKSLCFDSFTGVTVIGISTSTGVFKSECLCPRSATFIGSAVRFNWKAPAAAVVLCRETVTANTNTALLPFFLL